MRLMCSIRQTLRYTELLPQYRFIRTIQSDHVIRDEATGIYRLSSKAFGPSSSDGFLSGDLEQPLVADRLSALALYPAVDRAVGAVGLTIWQICDHSLISEVAVHHDPVKRNWYHGSISGIKKKKTKDYFRLIAIELVPIDQDEARRRDPNMTAFGSASAITQTAR
jgi:hypothetical protein